MPQPKPEDIPKKLTLNIDGWFRKNERKIRLIDDLTLDCEICKSRAAQVILEKEIDLNLRPLRSEVDRLNKLNKDLFKGLGKTERKGLMDEVKDIVDKRTTIFNKDNVKLNVKVELDDGVPLFKIEGTF